MRPSIDPHTRRNLPAQLLSLALRLGLCFVLGAAAPALARAEDEAPKTEFDKALAAITGGKPIVDVNFRWEYGKIDQRDHSHGATVRTRLGYQSAPYYGFTGLVEMVNTESPKPGAYFDAVDASDSNRTVVADPSRTDVNRVWLGFKKKEWGGLDVKGGRQRIKLDDDRWVGNVGWRQNEQTFDAARLQANFGIEKLLAQYIYSWEVNRIFGDQGPRNRRDFGPRSHFFNVAYDYGKPMKAVGFVYLVDPNDRVFRAFGSATYGLRLTGAVPIDDDWSLPYQASYAFQEDFGNNPVSYDAHYYLAEGGVKRKGIGSVHVGYEVLGSDTDARIVTPFSTAHKFNGFADAFLDNGGVRGLRDFFFTIRPAVPIKGVKLSLIFHQFWDDQGGDNLGQEYNLVTSYKLNKYISFLWKAAYYTGKTGTAVRPDRSRTTRSILQTTFKF